jgi:hypothetical protein
VKRVVLIPALLVTLIALGFLFLKKDKSSTPQTSPIPTSETSESSNSVPLPQEQDVIRLFFSLISDARIPEAIDMMTPQLVGDDSSKQAWGVQFNSFESIEPISIEPAIENTYKVVLQTKMKPNSADAKPIPYYGWGDGQFTRWVTLSKINGLWKISEIATGP